VNDFTNLAERIEQRASAVTEALQQEMQSLEKVEETLNKRYRESVTNVLNSLRNSMDEQENELINEKMKQVSKLIETKSNEILSDWEKRMKNTQKAMSEMRQQIVKEDEEALAIQKKMLAKSREQTNDMMKRWEEANKERADYTWLWIAMFAVWTVGIAWGAIYLSQNPQILKSEEKKQITQEDVMQVLEQSYILHKTAEGWRLVEKQGDD